MEKPKIIVSGINLTSGGILSILLDCLTYLKNLTDEYDIIVLINNKKLVGNLANNFTFIEYPLSKKSWFIRCYYEYIHFYFLSKRIRPYLWLSLHDITPNVSAERLAVYCHNPSPFYKVRNDELFLDKKFTLFTWFYKYLYKINIHKNDYVIVQQQWMRDAFRKMYEINKIIVASPKMDDTFVENKNEMINTFIYPTFSRPFKNIELIGEALKLIDDIGIKVLVTIDGSENAYAKKIVDKYKNLKSISFIGLQSRKTIFDYYGKVTGLIFPSKLETWGMPMSEFAVTGKVILASDLPFARENLAGYSKAKFFSPDDGKELADLLQKFILSKNIKFDCIDFKYDEPYAKNWQELFGILLNK